MAKTIIDKVDAEIARYDSDLDGLIRLAEANPGPRFYLGTHGEITTRRDDHSVACALGYQGGSVEITEFTGAGN